MYYYSDNSSFSFISKKQKELHNQTRLFAFCLNKREIWYILNKMLLRQTIVSFKILIEQ